MSTESKISPRTRELECCPVCGSEESRLLFKTRDRLHKTPGEFSYQKCASCGSVYQDPMVIHDDLHLCYPSEYAPHNLVRELPNVDVDDLPSGTFHGRVRRAVVDSVRGRESTGLAGTVGRALASTAFFRTRAFYGLVMDECLPRGSGPHYALDVGCGAGWFMQRLQKVGWTVEGLEWDEDAAARASETTGSKVSSGDFLSADLPRGKFHLIVLNHVFEHFEDPRAVLVRIRELLADNGRAVLLFPNPNALGAGRFSDEWFPWEVPRHLVLPSVKGLRVVAEKAGFRDSNVYSRADYSEVHWQRSRAYRTGRHPETDAPPLDASDKFGVAVEKLVTALGFDRGWETVAILRN